MGGHAGRHTTAILSHFSNGLNVIIHRVTSEPVNSIADNERLVKYRNIHKSVK